MIVISPLFRKMLLNFFIVPLFFCIFSQIASQLKPDIDCPPGDRHRARSKPYFPGFDQGGFIDMLGAKLNSLQEFLAGEAKFVTLSLDSQVPIPVGTPICIPEVNRKYNRSVLFKGKHFTVFHMCVHNESFSDDRFFNQFFTLVIPNDPKVPVDDNEDIDVQP